MFPNTVLIDRSSKILLLLSAHPAAAIYLSNNIRDVGYVPYITYPNYLNSFFLAGVEPDKLPNWTWNWKTRTFTDTRPDVITNELRERSQLTFVKHDVISQMMYTLSATRNKMTTGVSYEETVYLSKKLQAQAFKDTGYNDDMILEFPYVLQYADFAQISPKQAADDILFAARLDDERLLKTELRRMTYYHKVIDAANETETRALLNEFYQNMSGNALS